MNEKIIFGGKKGNGMGNKHKLLLEMIVAILLTGNLKMKEEKILLRAKRELEQEGYLPKILNFLEAELSHLALQEGLSSSLEKLYQALRHQSFQEKSLSAFHY